MKTHRLTIALLSGLTLTLLAGCHDETPSSAAEPGVISVPETADAAGQIAIGGTCGAQEHQTLVGQNRAVLGDITFPAPTRVIGPDGAVTMDFVPNRLNLCHDENGIIERVECG